MYILTRVIATFFFKCKKRNGSVLAMMRMVAERTFSISGTASSLALVLNLCDYILRMVYAPDTRGAAATPDVAEHAVAMSVVLDAASTYRIQMIRHLLHDLADRATHLKTSSEFIAQRLELTLHEIASILSNVRAQKQRHARMWSVVRWFVPTPSFETEYRQVRRLMDLLDVIVVDLRMIALSSPPS